MKLQSILIAIVAALFLPGIALAQPGIPSPPGNLPFSNTIPNRPAVSPYLNLLNSTNSGISNYYTLVKPQLQAREEMIRQQVQLNQIQRQVQRGQPGGVPVRGSQEIRGTG